MRASRALTVLIGLVFVGMGALFVLADLLDTFAAAGVVVAWLVGLAGDELVRAGAQLWRGEVAREVSGSTSAVVLMIAVPLMALALLGGSLLVRDNLSGGASAARWVGSVTFLITSAAALSAVLHALHLRVARRGGGVSGAS